MRRAEKLAELVDNKFFFLSHIPARTFVRVITIIITDNREDQIMT